MLRDLPGVRARLLKGAWIRERVLAQSNKEHDASVAVSTSRLTYRPDIDGLRAIAVLFVFAYHLDVFNVFGGFIGVDVFFVISGFLISSLIFKEMAESRFSMLGFYERRIRRILPALFVMMAVTAVVASIYLLPSELEQFARSLPAAAFSFSNLYFLQDAGYFSPNDNKPLIHTWSLGVEEQFYIFFPLFLVCINRYWPERCRQAVVWVAALSFVASAYGAYAYPTATFYLPVTRLWEFLLGTMLCLRIFPAVNSRIWRNVLSAAGLVFIVASAFAYSSRTHFPGIAALVPCVGAALILAAGEKGSSLVGRFLALRPLAFIGIISYSLYLYHWPIIVFQKMSMMQFPDASNRSVHLSLLIISLLVATLSWRLVEVPFRRGRFLLKGKAAFRFAAAGAGALTVAGITIIVLHGFPARYSPAEVAISSYLGTFLPSRSGTCFIESGEATTKAFDVADCLRQDASRKNYLLLGDSHAAQLWFGLKTVFPDINFLQASASGCEPTMQHRQPRLPDRLDDWLWGDICKPMMDYIFNDYLRKSHVDEVLLAGRWEPDDLPRLDYTIRTLKSRGVKVLLFGPIVQYDSPLPRLLVASLRTNDPALPLHRRLTRYRQLDDQLAQKAANLWSIPYVSYFALLCRGGACLEYAAKDVPLQSDYGHLTQAGSLVVSERLRDANLLVVR